MSFYFDDAKCGNDCSKFNLNEESGQITTNVRFDRSEKDEYILYVHALDLLPGMPDRRSSSKWWPLYTQVKHSTSLLYTDLGQLRGVTHPNLLLLLEYVVDYSKKPYLYHASFHARLITYYSWVWL